MVALEASGAPRILVHGHRGARAVRPENTLPAFEYAIQAGVEALELDLAVTKDNVLVVSHDPVLPEPMCTGPGATRVIRQMTLAQLREWDCGSKPNPQFPKQQAAPGTPVPSLEEVLALAPRGKFEFNIETKIFRDKPEYTPSPEEFARLLVELIRVHRLETRCMIQSFDFRTLAAAKKLAPRIRLSALFETGSKDVVASAKAIGAAIVSPHMSLVNKQIVVEAHQAGMQVVPWTANTREQWDPLIEAGVDAIISDDPAALIAYLKQRGLR